MDVLPCTRLKNRALSNCIIVMRNALGGGWKGAGIGLGGVLLLLFFCGSGRALSRGNGAEAGIATTTNKSETRKLQRHHNQLHFPVLTESDFQQVGVVAVRPKAVASADKDSMSKMKLQNSLSPAPHPIEFLDAEKNRIEHRSEHMLKPPSFAVRADMKVVCDARAFEKNRTRVFSKLISGTIHYLNESIIQSGCPCFFDVIGVCRQANHFCHGPMSNYICSYHVRNATVPTSGVVLAGKILNPEVFWLSDSTLMAEQEPQYNPSVILSYEKWTRKMIDIWGQHPTEIYHHVKALIPARMHWDDSFNHLSFQSMPLIGLVYEFHHDLFYSTHWQVSRFTGALLVLLGVRRERLVVEESVFAKEAILPWMKHWNPTSGAPLLSIARRVSLIATRRLLSTQLGDQATSHVVRLVPRDARYAPMTLNVSADTANNIRYVVYFNRTMGGARAVVNEPELLRAISEHLRPGYRLVVLPPMKEYRSIPELHAMWQQYALIVNRAVVLIGAHGGGLNNMMWAPDDCDLIEFNEYLDDEIYKDSHGGTPVRRLFMNAYWARSALHVFHVPLAHNGSSMTPSHLNKSSNVQAIHWQPRYWIIQPVKRDARDFYFGSMKVLKRDVLRVLAQIPRYGQEVQMISLEIPLSMSATEDESITNAAISRRFPAPAYLGLLRNNSIWEDMPMESVGTWPIISKKVKAVVPKPIFSTLSLQERI